ncbi:uncharacterized protein METZ01_LOCUS349743 [marine metagenome]|uniref:Uncharacterized protein n=1 Tax=marine metagenome TaxID=408172 RepID=A0A382RGP4_9ZZZZ
MTDTGMYKKTYSFLEMRTKAHLMPSNLLTLDSYVSKDGSTDWS